MRLSNGGTQMTKHKACPFCGAEKPTIYVYSSYDRLNEMYYAYVVCGHCCTNGPVSQSEIEEASCEDVEAQAWVLWDQRANEMAAEIDRSRGGLDD